MLVYRAEHNGTGIFCSGIITVCRDAIIYRGDRAVYDPNDHPAPHLMGEYGTRLSREKCDWNGNNHRYGCQSRQLFDTWFCDPLLRKELSKINDVRLCVYKVSVKHVLPGRFQCVFDIRKAELVSSNPFPVEYLTDVMLYELQEMTHGLYAQANEAYDSSQPRRGYSVSYTSTSW